MKAACAAWAANSPGFSGSRCPRPAPTRWSAPCANWQSKGLQVTVHTESGARPASTGSMVTLDLVGQDHPGILRQVSAVLAAHGVNVEELSSECVSAPMGGGDLFKARATALVPPTVNMSALRADLEKIAADVMVDLKLS